MEIYFTHVTLICGRVYFVINGYLYEVDSDEWAKRLVGTLL